MAITHNHMHDGNHTLWTILGVIAALLVVYIAYISFTHHYPLASHSDILSAPAPTSTTNP